MKIRAIGKPKKGYQRAIRDIVIEPNQWTDKGGSPYQVSIYFNLPVYRYIPRFSEIRKVIDLLIELYGCKHVEESLNIKINDGEVI